ncbi:hypothetical protein ETD96_32700 [Actinomadura geliboluensis]|uniref:Uncharacterized protein n=1 Tax=Actinomadura geliboluensis TaxID=882440 RepID=A0A5S4GEL6_9ACTN|nr:hypothetical protein ETD96_32700 [Actinomadura geliboluensis]
MTTIIPLPPFGGRGPDGPQPGGPPGGGPQPGGPGGPAGGRWGGGPPWGGGGGCTVKAPGVRCYTEDRGESSIGRRGGLRGSPFARIGRLRSATPFESATCSRMKPIGRGASETPVGARQRAVAEMWIMVGAPRGGGDLCVRVMNGLDEGIFRCRCPHRQRVTAER